MHYKNIRKSTGWIYNILVPFVHLEYLMLFRKLFIYNKKGIPSDKPVLIAANHPTAFIDPLFFCFSFDPPVYNMTRGDIFRKPFYRYLMEQCNMFPVYRQRDGYESRDRNDGVFEYCEKKMLDGVAVNIFVEGEHHLDKRVLRLQKGIARIAFGTYEKHQLDELQIIPVGCNYATGDLARDEAKVNVGEPIFVKDYWEAYQANPNGAILQLCTDIRDNLLELCYHIEDPEDDGLADHLLELWRNDHPAKVLPIEERTNGRFLQEKALLNGLNAMQAEPKKNLRSRTSAYFETLSKSGISDEVLMRSGQGSWLWFLFLVIGFVPFLVGHILSWPFITLASNIARSKVKKREFRTSVLMGVTFVGSIILYMLLIPVAIFISWKFVLIFVLLYPFLCGFSVIWSERLRLWRGARKALKHPERANLLQLRKEIQYESTLGIA
ncbi:MAG: 1-acyl-sn-glycerol-3-phosphate acyltransferase [Saprospiraceae bacterium]